MLLVSLCSSNTPMVAERGCGPVTTALPLSFAVRLKAGVCVPVEWVCGVGEKCGAVGLWIVVQPPPKKETSAGAPKGQDLKGLHAQGSCSPAPGVQAFGPLTEGA